MPATPSLRGAKRRSNPAFLAAAKLDCFASLAMTGRHACSFPRTEFPGVCNLIVPLFSERAQGKPGADCARSPVCESATEDAHGLNYRYSQDIPAFPAQWSYGFLRALPGERPFLPPSSAGHSRQLDARVAAPGPHDFAVRCERFRPAGVNPPDAAASIASQANVS